MRAIAFLCLLLAATLAASDLSGQVTHDIYGLQPLHSMRLDVEKLFGQPAGSCRCIFRTAKETIAVDYSVAPCEGRLYGWNVPADTVLAFRVTPKIPFAFSEIELDPKRFVQTSSQDDNVTVFHTDVLNGIKYAVQDNHVIYIQHVPSTKDNRLRCRGFQPYDAGVGEYTPYDSFTWKNDVETSARLDNFAIQLSQTSSSRGYILAYAGKVARSNEGRKMADWARRYLLEKRNIPPDRVVAIDGGFRTSAGFDLFLLSDGMRPPTATPTVPSSKVKIIGR